MNNQEKLTWYEITVDVIPDINDKRHNFFYVSVSQWSEWEEFGNMRYNYNPFVGNYCNRRNFLDHVQDRHADHIIIADTIMDLDTALKLEEYLVKGFRSDDEAHGFNQKVGE